MVIQQSLDQPIICKYFSIMFSGKNNLKIFMPWSRLSLVNLKKKENSIPRTLICVYPYLGFPFYMFGHFSQLNYYFIVLPDCLQLVYFNLDIIHFILWLLNHCLQDVNLFLLSGRRNVIWNSDKENLVKPYFRETLAINTQNMGGFPTSIVLRPKLFTKHERNGALWSVSWEVY